MSITDPGLDPDPVDVDADAVVDASPIDRLWEEIVYIAYYLHWSFDSILELDHISRARVIQEIGNINAKLNSPDDSAGEWEG